MRTLRYRCVLTLAVMMAGVGAWGDGLPIPEIKDPLPDSLSLAGVTLYGTIDVGYVYQSKGVPLSGTYLGGLEYQSFTTTRNFAGSQSTVAESALEQSKIGVKIEEPIVDGLGLVGTVETGFNPLSGELTDACASIASNSGVKQGQQTANADSSRCGQPFNAQAYGGVSSPVYGTLTIGRHNAPELGTIGAYDPQTLSYAFSFLGYSGFNGGAGSTEGARWDNSVKYVNKFGPVHVLAMYSSGGADTGVINNAIGGGIGFEYQGFSIDGVAQHERGAVNLRSSFDDAAAPLTNGGLAAYISDDTSWNIMAKYTLTLGDDGVAPALSGDKVTISGGYSHIEKAHSSDSVGEAQAGYPLSIGITINASAIYNMEWAGAKLVLPSGWSFSGGFYHVDQNSWTIGLGPTGTQGIGCADAGLLCAGDFYEGSLLADYAFNKHYDVYAGVNYSKVTDGLANGFAGTTADGTTGSEDQTTFAVGFRVRF